MKNWTKLDVAYLRKNYYRSERHKLITNLGRSWSSIQNKASLLKIKRDRANANVLKLTNGTNESFYWLGFLIADGHFAENNQLQIKLGKKDLNHLRKFADYIEYKTILTKPSIYIGYSQINEWLKDRFDVRHNKTYYPCILKNMTGDNFFSFIIGFIDGDGTISKKGYMTLKCHKSWLKNIEIMIGHLLGIKYSGITKKGLASGHITKIETMKKIKKHILDLNLPVLNRKWERVNLDKLSKNEKYVILKSKCFDLFNQGLSPKKIINKIGASRAFVYKTFTEYRLTA